MLLGLSWVGCTEGGTGTDTGLLGLAGPCENEGWGQVLSPQDAVHVRADGDDETGDGSLEAPFATLDAALAASRIVEPASPIAIGPGRFDATLSLSDDSGEGVSDDGLSLEGCGPSETTLAGDQANAVVLAVDIQDLRIAGLRIEDGRRALWFRAGSIVAIQDVEVQSSQRLGIVVEGSSTLVDMNEVYVRDTVPENLSSGGSMGYGVSVDGGALTMRGGGVYGSTGVGILAAFASLELEDVTVSGTRAIVDGSLGRGVQLQELSLGVISGGTISENLDAGLFVSRAVDLQVDGLHVEQVAAGVVPGSAQTTGDGIVLTAGVDGSGSPADFTAFLRNVVIDGTDRAAVLLDGVTAEVTDHTHLNNGLVVEGSSTFTQQGAQVSGNVGTEDLADNAGLLLNHELVELDTYLD